MNLLYPHLSVNQAGHLAIGGADTLELAQTYGTPLYVMDEDAVRRMCRIYRQAAAEAFGQDALPLYASKALCCAHMYRIAAEEGMGVDCVSGGELYTARRIYFHGNNKTDRDIRDALEMGVGTFVADNREELDALERLAADAGRVQSILLRITPGIDRTPIRQFLPDGWIPSSAPRLRRGRRWTSRATPSDCRISPCAVSTAISVRRYLTATHSWMPPAS